MKIAGTKTCYFLHLRSFQENGEFVDLHAVHFIANTNTFLQNDTEIRRNEVSILSRIHRSERDVLGYLEHNQAIFLFVMLNAICCINNKDVISALYSNGIGKAVIPFFKNGEPGSILNFLFQIFNNAIHKFYLQKLIFQMMIGLE